MHIVEHITLRELFASKDISSRNAMSIIFSDLMAELCLRKPDSVIVSFKDIEFITRSAAHELITEFNQLKESCQVQIQFTDIDIHVFEMLRVVNDSINKDKISNLSLIQYSYRTEAHFINQLQAF